MIFTDLADIGRAEETRALLLRVQCDYETRRHGEAVQLIKRASTQ